MDHDIDREHCGTLVKSPTLLIGILIDKTLNSKEDGEAHGM